MEDLRYIGAIEAISDELQSIISNYNRRASGVTDKMELLAIRLEQNDVLVEALKKHRRTLLYHSGVPIEPVAHVAEAILIGVMGGNAA